MKDLFSNVVFTIDFFLSNRTCIQKNLKPYFFTKRDKTGLFLERKKVYTLLSSKSEL